MSRLRQHQTFTSLVVILLILLLPLSQHPGRYDPYEPHRVGVLLVAMAVLLPVLIGNRETGRTILRTSLLTRHTIMLWLAILVWMLALTLSSAFALSPSRAVFGDLIRRTGLLTHLLIMGAVLIGAMLPVTGLSLQRVGRWFWVAGVICSLVVILQIIGWLPNAYAPRAPGTIGVPTFTGGWLTLAILWSVLGISAHRKGAKSAKKTPSHQTTENPAPPYLMGKGWGTFVPRHMPLKPIVYGLGIVLMLTALVLTGSRGAALALLIGAWGGGVVWAITGKKRVWMAALIGAALAVVAGGVLLTRIDWNTSPLARLPLISRLNPSDDSTIRSRELIWRGTIALIIEHPTWQTIEGTPDPFAVLRPIIGYGLESFETVFRPAMTPELREREDGRPVDRAHNDWLDTGVTAGALGVIARAALWISVGSVGLHLAAQTTDDQHRREICILLAVIVAHIVDLQFSFTTVITGWTVWLAIGGLIACASSASRIKFVPLAKEDVPIDTSQPAFLSKTGTIVWIGVIVFALIGWFNGARADVLIGQALNSTIGDDNALIANAIQLRFWDDRLYTSAVFNQLQNIETWDPDQSWKWLQQAERLNPYDATTAFLIGVTLVEQANRAATDADYQVTVTQAEPYFAAAVRLSPSDGSYWREYARYAYWQKNDPELALALITRALELAPDDFAAQGLKAQIDILPR